MDETMELIQKAHHGDKTARDKLVEENMGLVWCIVRRFSGRGHELEDLFQIGSIGLMKAIDKFDLSYDVKFSTYAVPMIAGEIKRFLRDDGMIKVSRSIKEMGIKAKQISEKMASRMGREPTIDEIAAQMGASREEVASSLEAGAEIESLYKTVNKSDDNTMYLLDKIEKETKDEDEILDRILLKEALSILEEKEREIIIRRYFENQTQSQIAAQLNISQVQVSRMEKKILKQMRNQLNKSKK